MTDRAPVAWLLASSLGRAIMPALSDAEAIRASQHARHAGFVRWADPSDPAWLPDMAVLESRRENPVADVITLSCPSCGAPPQITSDIDRFACAHCGAQHAVKRGAGPALLAPVVAELRQVRVGVDKTASELALSRLTGEVAALVRQRRPHKITHTPSWWVYVIGLLSSALAFGVLVDAFGGDMGCVSGGIAGVVIFGLVLAADDCMKGRRARDAERARLLHNARIDQEIRKRLEQIGRHRRLLSK